MSKPIKFLFNNLAATTVVPLPKNGSNTISPSLLAIFNILSKSSIGF